MSPGASGAGSRATHQPNAVRSSASSRHCGRDPLCQKGRRHRGKLSTSGIHPTFGLETGLRSHFTRQLGTYP
eukprot:6721669-Prorocentrum_lima.AAC.1